jgi:hypothetical protein
MGEERKVCKVFVGNPEGKSPLGRPDVDGDGIRMCLGRLAWEVWSGFNWLRIGAVGGLL